MKKEIAIFSSELTMNGSNIALINLLKQMNYTKFNIDLYLIKSESTLLKQLPKEVNIINVHRFSDITNKNKYIFKYPLRFINSSILRLFQNSNNNLIQTKIAAYRMPIVGDKVYDIAISFRLLGIDPYFTAYNIKAKYKLCWLHGIVNFSKKEHFVMKSILNKYNQYVSVSQTCRDAFLSEFPDLKKKTNIIYNVVDADEILKRATSGETLKPINGVNLLTIGRLSPEKGYDLVLEAARILREQQIDFNWTIIGDGLLYKLLKDKIKELNLNDRVFLKGTVFNPYGYLDSCDIYIQASLSESYCLSLAEARVLGKPIIATNIPAVQEQIISGKTGIISDSNARSLANSIINLIHDSDLRKTLIENLHSTFQGNITAGSDLESLIYDLIKN